MPAGGKLARLLQAVGGAPRDDQQVKAPAKRVRSIESNGARITSNSVHPNRDATSRGPSLATSAPHGETTKVRKGRKRRREKQRPAAGIKRSRREAGPAAKAAATGSGRRETAGQALADDSELVAAERQSLLGGRSAYEALMDELARSARGRDRRNGGAAAGGGRNGKADLRAHLALLRSEQMGQSSDEEEDEEGEEEEGDSSDEGEEEEDEGLMAAAAANGLLSGGPDGAGSDDEDKEEDEGEEEGEEGSSNDGSDGGGAANGHAVGDGKKKKKKKTAAAGRKAGGEVGSGDGASSGEAEEEEEQDGDEDGQEARGKVGANGTSGTAVAAAVVDTWARHVGRELSDAEVASLTAAGTCSYVDAPSVDELHLTAWGPHARWQLRAYGNSGVGLGSKKPGKAAKAAGAAALPVSSVGLAELPSAPANLREYGVKERLVARWREVRQEDEARTTAAAGGGAGTSGTDASASATAAAPAKRPALPDFVSPQQRSLFALLNSYVDIHLPYRPYPTDASLDAADPLLDAVLLHALNHVAKTADRIKKNNHALQLQKQQQAAAQALKAAQQQQKGKGKGRGKGQPDKQLPQQQAGEGNVDGDAGADRAGAGAAEERGGQRAEQQGDQEQQEQEEQQQHRAQVEEVGGTPRDQGFTRPKVLVLLPQRNFAFRAVRRLVALAIRETRSDSVQGKERFVEQFTDPEEGDTAEENMDAAAKARLAARPPDHRALFAGNVDDHFRLGIKVTKGAIRLFADLYDSDIIVASPVALATKLAEDRAADPHSSPDYLSSIELLLLDRADVMGMQNWAHVETVVSALNQLPRSQHGTDIMRVRDWYLSGLAPHYRQTVLLAAFPSPDTNALARAGANGGGALRLAVEQQGVLGRVIPQVRQLFERFPAASPAAAGDARFEFFMRSVWPRLKDSVSRGLLLFVPSYFDFVRVRNALKADDSVDFATISEYSSNAEVTRARARFYHGQRRMLLYTERAHFYHRYRIRGIKDVLFYGLPEHGEYYSELINLLEEGGGGGVTAAASHHQATVTALFCPWDVLALERVVGSGRARRMLKGESGTYMFC